MGFLDIHSHILPGIDDGAKSIDESIKLLSLLKQQGADNVILTPHFNASTDSITDFEEAVERSYKELSQAVKGKNLPGIFLGCEVLYFNGIGSIQNIGCLCIKNTNYMLLEFGNIDFDDKVISDLCKLCDQCDVVPVIAHIERYFRFKGYRKLLKLVGEGKVLAQVNAPSFENKIFKRPLKKLFKKQCVTFLASDTHTVEKRPPKMDFAFAEIVKRFGESERSRLIKNSNDFLSELTDGLE